MRIPRLLIVIGLACIIAAMISPPALGSPGLAERLEHIEADEAGLCPLPASQGPLQSTIRGWAAELRPKVTAQSRPRDIVDALNQFLTERLAIKSSQDLHDPCNLLPSAVVERKQGYCVGVAALYLALAQELDLPIFAVATPSHVFLRYDDGTTRINVDTTQIGASKSDDSYVKEGRIPETSMRKGVFMRNLSDDGFLAQVRNNLGVVYSERKNYVASAKEYREAVTLDRHLPAAWYNWGNDRLKTGDDAGAARDYTRSLKLFPSDVWALNNRGIASMKRGKVESARRDFEEALRIDPGFEQARSNLAAIVPGSP